MDSSRHLGHGASKLTTIWLKRDFNGVFLMPIYMSKANNDLILLMIYVDDIIIIGSEASAVEHIKSDISKVYDMAD